LNHGSLRIQELVYFMATKDAQARGKKPVIDQHRYLRLFMRE
jgi:hypothetical protein